MAKDHYVELPLTAKLPANFDITSIVDDCDGFRITVESEGKKFLIRFDQSRHPYAYRNADEGKRLRTMGEQNIRVGIYAIENSDLSEWLHGESSYTHDMALHTYAVVSVNDWIELVGFGELEAVSVPSNKP